MELNLNYFIPVVITKPIQSVYELYQLKKNSPEKIGEIDELKNKTAAIAIQCFAGAALSLAIGFIVLTNLQVLAVPLSLLCAALLDKIVMLAHLNCLSYVLSIAVIIIGIAEASFLTILAGIAVGGNSYMIGLDLEKRMERQLPYYHNLKNIIYR